MQSPLVGSDGVVTFEIESDGTPLPGAWEVVSIRTWAETNRIPGAEIVLADGDLAEGTFPAADGTELKPGAEIAICAGYSTGRPSEIFKGIVVALRLRIGENGAPLLEVTCRDKAYRLTQGRASRTWVDTTDGDAIRSILGDHGLACEVAGTASTAPLLVQHYCTDWDFVLARAEANGLVVDVAAGKVTVAKPAPEASPALKLTLGEDILAFDAEVDARGQFGSVAATSWDPADQAIVEEQKTPSGAPAWGDLTAAALAQVAGGRTCRVQTASALDAGVLAALAEARLDRALLARQRGTVSFQGSALARPGAMIELAGLGTRFGGRALIGRVVHRIEAGNWITEAGLGLAAEALTERPGPGALEAPAAAGAAPPVRGLQIGVVKKLDADPGGGHRIQVELPLHGKADALVWARLGTPYASNGAGLMFRPEISDEVVIGFLSDDPAAAVILGALHSAKNPPPEAGAEENPLKTILTRAKLKIAFDDKEKCLTLATPGGNTLVLDDKAKAVTLKDQHGNSLKLDQGGITLDSAKDVTIKAAGKVAVQATGNLELKSSGGDATVEGMNVKATGQTTFSASGAASAELKASGALKIQGGLVQIN